MAYENSGTGARKCDNDGSVEYARRRTRTFAPDARNIGGSSTLNWERARALSGFGVSGCRVLSTGNENARFRNPEYQGVEYPRLETRTLASWIRSIRMSSTFDWKRERSSPGFGISGCRVLSTALEHTQLLAIWNTADGSLGARSLGQVGGLECASQPAFIPGSGPTEANRQPAYA